MCVYLNVVVSVVRFQMTIKKKKKEKDSVDKEYSCLMPLSPIVCRWHRVLCLCVSAMTETHALALSSYAPDRIPLPRHQKQNKGTRPRTTERTCRYAPPHVFASIRVEGSFDRSASASCSSSSSNYLYIASFCRFLAISCSHRSPFSRSFSLS